MIQHHQPLVSAGWSDQPLISGQGQELQEIGDRRTSELGLCQQVPWPATGAVDRVVPGPP